MENLFKTAIQTIINSRNPDIWITRKIIPLSDYALQNAIDVVFIGYLYKVTPFVIESYSDEMRIYYKCIGTLYIYNDRQVIFEDINNNASTLIDNTSIKEIFNDTLIYKDS